MLRRSAKYLKSPLRKESSKSCALTLKDTNNDVDSISVIIFLKYILTLLRHKLAEYI
ncbi:hypothetical protein THF5H11_20005 [Vibrio jasicida]|nr:hypothetical protein THF5H11_20005 [Vibrio jasicida]